MLYVNDTSIKQEEKKVMFQDTCDQMLLILKEIHRYLMRAMRSGTILRS